jgi:TolB-like protein
MYVNDEADFGFYSRVGVLPFSNLSSDRNASEKVTSSFTTELLKLNSVAVATQGDVENVYNAVVKQAQVNVVDELTSEQAVAIGEQAQVEGIFVGAVKDFGMVRSGQEEFPLVAVIVRFIDCQTGRVVWSYETSRKGGPKFPIFSFGETHTLGEMTTKVCREVANSFGSVSR